ncbi:MAG: zinc ribbon domain-containing protein [Blastocatellia bacterium]|nr:zinc ribbon domain-containing protein [Blastocatellia bacterium]
MFCSKCGTEVRSGISYCNRCGTELSQKAAKATEFPTKFLIFGMVATCVFGLAFLTFLTIAMKVAQLPIDLMAMFMGLSFLLLAGIEGFFVWLLVGAVRQNREPQPVSLARGVPTNELQGESATPLLPEPPVSVTEHTTRNLEPVRQERFQRQ